MVMRGWNDLLAESCTVEGSVVYVLFTMIVLCGSLSDAHQDHLSKTVLNKTFCNGVSLYSALCEKGINKIYFIVLYGFLIVGFSFLHRKWGWSLANASTLTEIITGQGKSGHR